MSPVLPGFLPLDGVYEPSAIVQLPDGRFLVIEDEKEHPLCFFSLNPEGRVTDRKPVEQGLLDFNDRFWKLDDLEGLALGRSGEVYPRFPISPIFQWKPLEQVID